MSGRALLLGCFVAWSALACEDSLLPAGPITATEGLISYLEVLSNDRFLETRDLEDLLQGSPGLARVLASKPSSARLLHVAVLRQYFEDPALDGLRVNAWLESKLRQLGHRAEARDLARGETHFAGKKMEFAAVAGGNCWDLSPEFYASPNLRFVEPFELMTTLVTYQMWIEYMGQSPSHFPGSVAYGDGGQEYVVDGDFPVASVTVWSAAEFANRVSRAHGLKPYYPLDGILWKSGTSAAQGTLRPENESEAYRFVEALREIEVSADTGYRLPSVGEWEYIASHFVKLGVQRGSFALIPLEEGRAPKDWGFFAEHADGHPGSVTEDSFFELNGAKFYGLFGNLWQWTNDYTVEARAQGNTWTYRLTHFQAVGGSYRTYARHLQARQNVQDFVRDDAIGFRLARSLR